MQALRAVLGLAYRWIGQNRMRRYVLAVTGLALEARIAAGPGVLTVAGGCDSPMLARRIDAAIGEGAVAIMSFGIAGALEPSLAPGACIVARAIVEDDARWLVDARWADALERKLGCAIRGDIAGVGEVVTDVEVKKELYVARGALAVDMESHVAARLAFARGLPFAALRVVSDPAQRSLPRASIVGLHPDGRVDLARVTKSLLEHPRELPLLLRTALDAARALRALRRCRALLGLGLGFADLGELARDVP